MIQSIEADLFAALDIVVMEFLDDGYFKMVGAIPNWFIQFYPEAADGQKLAPETKFPFLENFIIDAQEFWASDKSRKLTSSIWTEFDEAGNEYHFEASVFKLNNTKLLLVSLVEEAYQEKQFLVQKCRESNLNYQKLVKEVQKKEILIHCIIHDLAGQLTAIKCCFDLLSFQNLTPKGIDYLQTGKKQTTKEVAQELKDTTKSLEKKIGQLDDQSNQRQRELRQQILDQSKSLDDDMRQKYESILSVIDREVQELRSDKTDRSTLAALLTQVAMQLNNEFEMPKNH